MFAKDRTSAGAKAAHKKYSRAVVLFQIIDIGLEARGVSNTDTSRAPVLEEMIMPCVAIGAERRRPRLRKRNRRQLGGVTVSGTATAVVVGVAAVSGVIVVSVTEVAGAEVAVAMAVPAAAGVAAVVVSGPGGVVAASIVLSWIFGRLPRRRGIGALALKVVQCPSLSHVTTGEAFW